LKVRAVWRTVQRPRFLDLYKEDAERFVQLFGHKRFYSKNRINILDVFKIFIQPEFPQDFAHSVVGYGGNVGDPFL
jgi:hypothetical protein